MTFPIENFHSLKAYLAIEIHLCATNGFPRVPTAGSSGTRGAQPPGGREMTVAAHGGFGLVGLNLPELQITRRCDRNVKLLNTSSHSSYWYK